MNKAKLKFRTVLYTEMDKVDLVADINGFNFDKIWEAVQQQIREARKDELIKAKAQLNLALYMLAKYSEDYYNGENYFNNRLKELKGM